MTIRLFGCVVVAGCLSAIGCGRSDQITSYDAPKETAPSAAVAAPAATGPPTTRMLAAVLPDGDKAWFFKITGPIAQLEPLAEPIEKFLSSVRLAADKPHPDWVLPATWKGQAGTGMRAATILVPAGDEALELTVTALPWTGGPGEMLGNVNRWRGQLQLPATTEVGLADCTHDLQVGDATMTVVDLSGRLQSSGMMPPFAGGAMSGSMPGTAPPIASGATELPPGHPPIDTMPGAATTPAGPVNTAPFKYDVPQGWQTRPAAGFRKAEFLVEDGGKSATFTAIDFPLAAGPAIADPTANVNRWRNEVGLPPLSAEEVEKSMQKIEVGNDQATFVDAVPDASQPDQSQAAKGTLAAMLQHGDTIWFFKLIGDRDLVAAQREKFLDFVKSVRFDGQGAGDVN